uniref:Uncharacterized protein n=1 Tax=Wuchereria bancrofti TaxID=6293 RepID=A0A1I8EUP7_WUCBA
MQHEVAFYTSSTNRCQIRYDRFLSVDICGMESCSRMVTGTIHYRRFNATNAFHLEFLRANHL